MNGAHFIGTKINYKEGREGETPPLRHGDFCWFQNWNRMFGECIEVNESQVNSS